MEGSESSVMRIGRSIWTVWGYLTGAVGRYLRPEVTNKENPNANSKEKDPVIKTINKSCRDLKEIEEEKERHETKTWNPHERQMREVAGLQCSGVKVQTATVQWEKVSVKQDAVGNGDHDEDSGTSKHLAVLPQVSIGDQVESAEDVEKKAQELRRNEETLDYHLNINNKARNILITDQLKEDHKVSPGVFINADIDSQEFDVSGGKDPDLDMNVSGNIQDERIKSEKKRADDMMDCVVDRTETMDSEDVEEEQINSCDNGDKEYTKEASVGNVIDQVNQDIKENSSDKQTHQGKACNENKTSESQMEDDLSQLIYPTSEGGNLLKIPIKKDIKEVIHKEEASTNKATVIPESGEINSVETEQGTLGKIKNGQHEEVLACVPQQLCEFTATEIFDKQQVYESKMHDAQTERTENKIEMQCEQTEFVAAQIEENSGINKKEIEEEKERHETKTWNPHERQMREVAGLRCSGVRVQAATVQCEKVSVKQDAVGNGDHDEDSGTSKHLAVLPQVSIGDQVESAEDVEKKAQELRLNEETLDYHLNINNKARNILITDQLKEDHKVSPGVFINADIDSQEFDVSGGKDPDLDMNVSGNIQDERIKSEKKRADDMMDCVVDRTETMDSEDVEEEQINSCDNGDKEYTKEASVGNVIDQVNQDIKENSSDKQTHQGKACNENKTSESQMEDDLSQLIYPTSEGGNLLKIPIKKDIKEVMHKEEASTNKATVIPESGEINSVETEQETLGKIKNGQHEEVLACVPQQLCEFTATEIFDKQQVYESKMHDAQTERTENKIEMQCEQTEFVAAQIEENSGINKKEIEEEKERHETKTWNPHERQMREVAGLQCSGVRVQAATVQCEKVSVKQDAVGNGDHDEDSGTNKHLAVLPQVSIGDQVESAEDVEKKAQELRLNEETLDYHLNINNKARNILITDQLKEDHKVSPGVFINADIDSQEFDVSGGKDPDLDMNVSGNIQDERIKSEKKRADDMMDCVVDRTETMDSEDVEEEQINSCDNGDKEYTKEASVGNVIDQVNQDIKENSSDKQTHQGKACNENKTSESQMEDDLSQLIYPTSEGGNLLKIPIKKDIKEVMHKEEASTNKATVIPESGEINSVETEQETLGKIKNGQHEEVLACVPQQLCEFTATEIFDKQQVYESKMHDAQTERTENKIEMQCEQTEFVAAQIEENSGINKKEIEEEKERHETKTWNPHERQMREVAGLRYSGVRVQAATVQCEKVSVKQDAVGNGDHDEDSGTSKHLAVLPQVSIGDQVESAEDVEKKAQELRLNEETLDYHLNINNKARNILITDQLKEDHKVSPGVFINADIDSQEFDVSGGKDPDLDMNVSGNIQDERIKSEKKRADDMMDCVVDRTETMDSEDVEEEQINSCDNGDKEYTKEASVGNVIDQVNQDIKENSSDKQTHQGKACNENKTSESQMEDDLSQLIYPTSEGGNLLKIPIKKDIKEVIHKEEASTNKATVIPESGEINSVETEQGTLGKIKNGQHEEVLACVPQQLCEFTATEIFDKQLVYESKMHDAQTERTENKIEMQCEQTEFVAAQIEENSGINKKEIEPCSHMGLIKVTFADSSLDLATDLLRVTMESDPLEQHKEDIEVRTTLKTEEASPKTEVMWLDDTEYISGSQRSEVVIKQGTESVIPRVQVEAGSQSKTEDPRSKCKQDIKAEVSSEDVMKSAIVEINLQEHSTNREEALQKTAYQYSHEQEPGQEKSANGILNEPELLKAPFYEMLGELRGTETNSAGQTDETSVKSTDQMSSPSLEELDKKQCSIELSVGSTTELIVETKTTSTEQKLLLIKQSEVAGTCKPATTELKCQQAESENDTSKTESESSVTTTEATSETCIMSTETEAPVLHMSKTLNLLRDQLIYSEGMAQDKSDKTESCGSNLGSSETSDLASPLQTLKMWRNAQKDDDDDDEEDDEDRTVETVPGLPDEIKAITTLGVLEEVMSGLTKERQSELSRQRVSPDNRITEIEGEKIELLNDTVDQRNDLQVETMDTGSGACGQNEVEKMAQYTRGEKEQMELTAKGKTNMPHKLASVSEVTIHTKKDHEEKNDYGESVIDNNENTRERNRPRLKRRFEKMEKEEKDKPSVRKDWAMADLFPLQVSSLDFTVQKSKIAVKNPLIRPPKDPRTLINMTSVEPLNPPCPPGPSLQRKSLAEGVSVMGKGVIGFKLPGLGSGLPVLRQTEAGRKMRDKEDAQCVTSQKFGMQTDPEDKCGKQDQMHDKPKSAPLRHPGMGSQQMMMELKNKLTKNKNAKE